MLYLDAIIVPANRLRKEFDQDYLAELSNSIASKGLLNPITVRETPDGYELVAGENRMRAVSRLHDFEIPFNCNSHRVATGKFPCLLLSDLSEEDRLEAELEENTCRRDLSWQEKADGRARLFTLRKSKAESKGETYNPTTLAEELKRSGISASGSDVSRDLRLAKHLNDPEVAKQKTEKDALKVIQKKQAAFFQERLAAEVTKEETVHTLYEGDCRGVLSRLQDNTFPVILTDPPYGIGVDKAGSQVSGAHHYDDSADILDEILEVVPEELYRVAAENAHLYWFCDLQWMDQISTRLADAGWSVDVYPIIWNKNGRGIAPDTQYRHRRTYEIILFATKGSRPLLQLAADVITVSPTSDLQQAEKPVELLSELLRRSAQPGDTILDPFAGSGSIFLAASKAQCKATGIELDPVRANLAKTRLNGE